MTLWMTSSGTVDCGSLILCLSVQCIFSCSHISWDNANDLNGTQLALWGRKLGLIGEGLDKGKREPVASCWWYPYPKTQAWSLSRLFSLEFPPLHSCSSSCSFSQIKSTRGCIRTMRSYLLSQMGEGLLQLNRSQANNLTSLHREWDYETQRLSETRGQGNIFALWFLT